MTRRRCPLALAAALAFATSGRAQPPEPTPAGPVCPGGYADDLTALRPGALAIEGRPEADFSYCVKSSATYECLSYGADGSVQTSRKKASQYGTAFGYRRDETATYLVSNEHLVGWPLVTTAEHGVEDVPDGCKRVDLSLRVVDDQADTFEDDDTPLELAAADPRLDLAVLKTPAHLEVMPWKVGKSAALRTRNIVEVRGFPLGVFRATILGKVISVYDHDTYRDWNHDDFVVDALLSAGNSGSPVLAISCETGEYELVGIYHAGYTRGAALNVVIAIDQAREFLDTLKPSAEKPPVEAFKPDPSGRARVEEVSRSGTFFFPFGRLTAAVRAGSCGTLVFQLFGPEFPLELSPVAVVEDLPPKSGDRFGEMGRLYIGREEGLREVPPGELRPEDERRSARVLEGLREAALGACAYQAAAKDAHTSRKQAEGYADLKKRLKARGAAHRPIAQSAIDMAERLAPPRTPVQPRSEVLGVLLDPRPCEEAHPEAVSPEIPRPGGDDR